MPRYLLTGAAGFIGSRVAELLLSAGHEVVGVDDLNDAYDPRLKRMRLRRLLREPAFSFLRLNIVDRGAVELIANHSDCGMRPFDAVLHLAARAGVRASVEQPVIFQETNMLGTLSMLELCRRQGIQKFVLASTSSVYGAAAKMPISEDAPTDRPLSPYAASKKAAETLAHSYHHLHGLDVSVLRYFTVYGPWGRPDMSVFRFVQNIAAGEPIEVYGDGLQERDFTFVDDIARGTIAALRPLGYEIINLGGDRPIRLGEIIVQISELLGQEPNILWRPSDSADVPATWADVRKARALLAWSPRISIEEGLRRTVAWYLENCSEMAGLRRAGEEDFQPSLVP